jgi:hypothetical protein
VHREGKPTCYRPYGSDERSRPSGEMVGPEAFYEHLSCVRPPSRGGRALRYARSRRHELPERTPLCLGRGTRANRLPACLGVPVPNDGSPYGSRPREPDSNAGCASKQPSCATKPLNRRGYAKTKTAPKSRAERPPSGITDPGGDAAMPGDFSHEHGPRCRIGAGPYD